MPSHESVLILGAGAVGANAALFLKSMGFAIELIDTATDLLQGAPQTSFVHHGDGFEYHKVGHRQTGKYCIDGSLVKGLLYPLSVFRTSICDDDHPIRFMVAKASLGKKGLTLDSFFENAERMHAHFARQFRAVRKAREWTEETASQAFLRNPEDFSHRLAPFEYADIDNVAGGCAGSGFGVNMPHYYAFLKAALREAGVPFHPSTETEAIEKAGGRYRVHAGGKRLDADHVLLAAGHHIPKLAAKVHGTPLVPQVSGMYYLNAMTFLRLPATSDPEKLSAARRINFTLQENGGGMFACVVEPTSTEDGFAATYFPSPAGSQKLRHYFDRLSPSPLPAEWDRLIAEGLSGERPEVRATFEQACFLYPFLRGYAEVIRTSCRPVFNAGTPANRRGSDRRVREISASPMFLSADRRISMWTSPKWTNAELVALMAADHVASVSGRSGFPKKGATRFGPTKLDVAAISRELSFHHVKMCVEDALQYAAGQGVPARIVIPTLPQFHAG
jgi:hypothetical protein